MGNRKWPAALFSAAVEAAAVSAARNSGTPAPVVELTAENTDQVVVRVTNGTLLMFPSYLEHSVDTNVSGGERISISFNIMFTSFTEQLSKPLW